MTLETSIQYLPGVGPKRARLLQDELGTGTVGDLLRLYPFRYIDRTAVQRIADLLPDQAYIQIRATVRSVKLLGKGGKPADPAKAGAGMRLSAIVEDGSGEIEVVFFKGVKWMVTRIVPGATFIFFGKPTVYGGRINLVHPEVDAPDNVGTGGLTGVYTSTEKLKTAGVTGKVMTKLIAAALEGVLPELHETLPDYIHR